MVCIANMASSVEMGLDGQTPLIHECIQRQIYIDKNPKCLGKAWRMRDMRVKTSEYIRNVYYSKVTIYTDGSKNARRSVGQGVFILEFGD